MIKKVIIEKKHEGMWLAVSPDYSAIMDYSDDIVSLTKKHGRDNAVYTKALSPDTS